MFQSFKTDAERSDWIQAHADYWTAIGYGTTCRYERQEHDTLEGARSVAHVLLKTDPGARVLIYAVTGVQSCYVETVKMGVEYERGKPKAKGSPRPNQ